MKFKNLTTQLATMICSKSSIDMANENCGRLSLTMQIDNFNKKINYGRSEPIALKLIRSYPIGLGSNCTSFHLNLTSSFRARGHDGPTGRTDKYESALSVYQGFVLAFYIVCHFTTH